MRIDSEEKDGDHAAPIICGSMKRDNHQAIREAIERLSQAHKRLAELIMNSAIRGAERQTREGNTMNRPLTWTTTEDLAIALADKFPDTDPLTVRFTDLHKWVMALEGFTDDAKNSNEKKLEAIQMAWHEEWRRPAG